MAHIIIQIWGPVAHPWIYMYIYIYIYIYIYQGVCSTLTPSLSANYALPPYRGGDALPPYRRGVCLTALPGEGSLSPNIFGNRRLAKYAANEAENGPAEPAENVLGIFNTENQFSFKDFDFFHWKITKVFSTRSARKGLGACLTALPGVCLTTLPGVCINALLCGYPPPRYRRGGV